MRKVLQGRAAEMVVIERKIATEIARRRYEDDEDAIVVVLYRL